MRNLRRARARSSAGRSATPLPAEYSHFLTPPAPPRHGRRPSPAQSSRAPRWAGPGQVPIPGLLECRAVGHVSHRLIVRQQVGPPTPSDRRGVDVVAALSGMQARAARRRRTMHELRNDARVASGPRARARVGSESAPDRRSYSQRCLYCGINGPDDGIGSS